MKNKIYISFIILLITFLFVPGIVNAKFTIEEAEKNINSREIYYELLDVNGNVLKKGTSEKFRNTRTRQEWNLQ